MSQAVMFFLAALIDLLEYRRSYIKLSIVCQSWTNLLFLLLYNSAFSKENLMQIQSDWLL